MSIVKDNRYNQHNRPIKMNPLTGNNTEQPINQTDRNLNNFGEGFNRNINLTNQENFIIRNLKTIQNVCDRNIKKIHCSVPIILSVAQVCVAQAYPEYWFLYTTAFLPVALLYKIDELQAKDERIPIDLQRRHMSTMMNILESSHSSVSNSPSASNNPIAYEELPSYSEEVSGDTESVILMQPLKNLDKVVYYDKQFYDYETLVQWHNTPENEQKVCPHNRQPLIWANVLKVENIHTTFSKTLTSKTPVSERLASFDDLRALNSKRRIAIQELLFRLNHNNFERLPIH